MKETKEHSKQVGKTQREDGVSSDNNADFFRQESFAGLLRLLVYQQKKKRSSFNISQLASKSNLSKSLLSLILKGQRKTSLKTAEALANAFQLRGRQRKYFVLLAKENHARTQEERYQLQNERVQFQSGVSETDLNVLQYRLLSSWLHGSLFVLCGMKNANLSIPSLIEVFQGQFRAEEIQKALDELLQLRLIRKTSKAYEQSHQAFVTENGKNDAALFHYHDEMLKLARKALLLESGAREFEGLTIGIPAAKLKEVKKRVHQFLSSLNEHLSESDESAPVYQINLNLFPLTKQPKDLDE